MILHDLHATILTNFLSSIDTVLLHSIDQFTGKQSTMKFLHWQDKLNFKLESIIFLLANN